MKQFENAFPVTCNFTNLHLISIKFGSKRSNLIEMISIKNFLNNDHYFKFKLIIDKIIS